MARVPMFAALPALACTWLLQACGGDGGQPMPVASDSAARQLVSSGFSGQFGFQLADEAETIGAGADGEGGIAIGARLRVRGAEVVVFDTAGAEIGRALTDDAGLVTFRPVDGSRSAIGVELRGNASAELYDPTLDRWVAFGPDARWRALVPMITANVGLGPLSEAWVTRYETQAPTRPIQPKAGDHAVQRKLAELIADRSISFDDLLRAEQGLARATSNTARVLEALGFALDARLQAPNELYNGLWQAPVGDREALVSALRAATFSGGRRGYQAGGDLPETGGVDVGLLFEVLAAFEVPTRDPALIAGREPVPPTSRMLRLTDILRDDLRRDGELDCADGAEPLQGELRPLIRCFGAQTHARITTVLGGLGLSQAVPLTDVAIGTTSIVSGNSVQLIAQDLGGALAAAQINGDGSLGSQTILAQGAEFHELGSRSMLVTLFDRDKPDLLGNRLFIVGDADPATVAAAGPAQALSNGFTGVSLDPLLPTASRGVAVVRAGKWGDQFGFLSGEGQLFLGGASEGIRAALGVRAGELHQVNGRPLHAGGAPAPQIIRDFAFKDADSLWLLDARRNCLLDSAKGTCTAPLGADRAWRMAIDLDGGQWMFAGEAVYVRGNSGVGDAALAGSRNREVWSQVPLAEITPVAPAHIESLHFTERFGYVTIRLSPDSSRPIGETVIMQMGEDVSGEGRVRIINRAESFLIAMPFALSPNLLIMSELFHEPDLADADRNTFGLGVTGVDDTVGIRRDPRFAFFAF
ncbi:MAG: hypothetical protein R3E83_16475 [Burkholderiaceae bacterium]